MTSVNLEKNLTYLKTQGSLLSERALFMLKNIFMFFSILKDIIQAQSETNHWIRWILMLIGLKRISEQCFSC